MLYQIKSNIKMLIEINCKNSFALSLVRKKIYIVDLSLWFSKTVMATSVQKTIITLRSRQIW